MYIDVLCVFGTHFGEINCVYDPSEAGIKDSHVIDDTNDED